MNKKYSIHVTKAVEEDLNDFKSYKQKVLKKLLRLEDNPYLGHSLSGKLKGLYSLEFSLPDGQCRAIYKIKNDNEVCLIIIIAPHENIYEKAKRRVQALKQQKLI